MDRHVAALKFRAIAMGVAIAMASACWWTLANAGTGVIAHKSGPIAISPDGSAVWVVNPDANTVTRILAGPDIVATRIAVGKNPRNLAVSPSGSEVWVTNYESNTVSVISTSSNAVVQTLPTLLGPFGVVITPDGGKAYVVNQLSDSLLTYDTLTRLVTNRQKIAHRARAIALTSDGSLVVVQQYVPGWAMMLTNFFDEEGGSLSAAAELLVDPIPQGDGGYPGVVQAIAVAPGDTTLWIPALDINPRNGQILYPGEGRLTLTSTMQAVVREVRLATRTEIDEHPSGGRRRLNSAGAEVQMPADVAFTNDGFAYIPCSFSNNVLKIDTATNPPATMIEIPAGDFPNGIAISPVAERAYVTNFLSRNVTVIDTNTDTVVGTIAVTPETLSPGILSGKKLFNTSTGRMSSNARITCAGCHPEGWQDGASWDFSHFGDGKRNSQALGGIAHTHPLHSIGDRDEVEDFEFNIQVLHFGQGLADGTDNPPVGPPNAGRSQDLDNLAAYVNSIPIRPESPFRNLSDQSLTSEAAAGKLIFERADVGCHHCHPEPLFTDNIVHDVGTFLASDTSGYQGYVTPTLRGAYDTDPYFHAGQAPNLQSIVAGLNPHDQHGKTTHLSDPEKDDLVAYVRSIITGKEDFTPPRVEYAKAMGLTEVVVRFLEPVDPVTATDIANYSIDNGVSVLSASLDPFASYMGRDGLTVHLFTTSHLPGVTYTLTVSGVKDLSLNGNVIAAPGAVASYLFDETATFVFSNTDSLYTARLGRDTYVSDGQPSLNYGRSGELRVGMSDATDRALVRFDFFPMLSTVVADTTDIVSAKIRLRAKAGASSEPTTIAAYRLLKYFVEGSGGTGGAAHPNQTNWSSAREGRLAWSGAGASASTPAIEGDAAADYLAANDRAYTPDDAVVVSAAGDWYEWDVTHAMRWAFANPYYWNFGHILVAESETPGSGKAFHALDDSVQANRPQLVVSVRTEVITGVPDGTLASSGYRLAPSRPNPARGATTLAFTLPREERVTLRIFDASGRAVRTLVEEQFGPGTHEIDWDGTGDAGRAVSAGRYFYRIKAGRFADARQLVFLR